MVETRRTSTRTPAAVADEDLLAEKPTITGGSPEVTIIDRPRRKHGSVAGVADKLKSLRNPLAGAKVGERSAQRPAVASKGVARASQRLKALMGRASGGAPAPEEQDPGAGAVEAEAQTAVAGADGGGAALEKAGWQRVATGLGAAQKESEAAVQGELASPETPRTLSPAEKLRRMKQGGVLGARAHGGAQAQREAEAAGAQQAAPEPVSGMQLAKGGKKALSAAQKLRALKR